MMNSNKDQAMAIITTTTNNSSNNNSITNAITASRNTSNTGNSNANNNNKSTEQAKGNGQPPSPPPLPEPGQLEKMPSRDNNTVFKSGPLYISSKGIGWTSWKKRWFILTRTSLVFFRSDPNAVPQKGSEVNLILGGIDLNNSGSVVVKADKKLLTVLFPDGRDGRAFTLKAETSEDLYEWKTALESALALAPSVTIVMGQNGILKNEQANVANGSQEQLKNKQPVKSSVIGRPILLALEDADGSPSFLEKALRFIEEHGIKVEGILRQAADVDDVEHRIREYEQGKTELSAEEDAHVIGDCIKYILREMPSSPVPTSCCTALLEAFRTDRSNRVNAMRGAICETFPDPNRRLLQRILLMMQAVASNKAETRMSISAVAACMAPLLLRPLLAGDCEIETNVNVGGDNSLQLLRAAAAANHAQAIVITLLEEYNNIFREDSMTPGLYSDSDEYGSEDELVTDDDVSYEDDEDYEDDDASEGSYEGSDAYTDEDAENASYSGTGDSGRDDLSETKEGDPCNSGSISSEGVGSLKDEEKSLSTSERPMPINNDAGNKDIVDQNDGPKHINVPVELPRDANVETTLENRVTGHSRSACAETTESDGPMQGSKRATLLGRTAARKNLSMESIDFKIDDEVEIQRLEASKVDLQKRISEEAQVNATLQADLEKRKKALYERRVTLEQDVARLYEQLQRERDKRTVLEAGFYQPKGPLLLLPAATPDEKMRVDLEEKNQAETDVTSLKQKIDDACLEICQQRELSMQNSNSQPVPTSDSQGKLNDAGGAATSQLPRRSSSKKRDGSMSGADSENGKKLEATSSSNRCRPQNELQVWVQKGSSKSSASTDSGRSATRTEHDNSENDTPENDKHYDSSSSPKKGSSKNQPQDLRRRSSSKSRSSSKKCDSKTEGASSASALTKLTTRLNFLKEKRGDLQNPDKGQGSGQAATAPRKTKSQSRRSQQNQGKGKGSEIHSAENPETGGRADGSQPSRDPDSGMGREGNSAASSEKRRKADGQSQQNTDERRSSEDQRSK